MNFAIFISGTYYLFWKCLKGIRVNESQYPKGFIKQTQYPFNKIPFDDNRKTEEWLSDKSFRHSFSQAKIVVPLPPRMAISSLGLSSLSNTFWDCGLSRN